MKNFVKLILPVAAFALASAGAVSTKETSSAAAPESGWRRISMNNCVDEVTCNNNSTDLCTIGGFQRFRKVGLDCVQPLYHKN